MVRPQYSRVARARRLELIKLPARRGLLFRQGVTQSAHWIPAAGAFRFVDSFFNYRHDSKIQFRVSRSEFRVSVPSFGFRLCRRTVRRQSANSRQLGTRNSELETSLLVSSTNASCKSEIFTRSCSQVSRSRTVTLRPRVIDDPRHTEGVQSRPAAVEFANSASVVVDRAQRWLKRALDYFSPASQSPAYSSARGRSQL